MKFNEPKGPLTMTEILIILSVITAAWLLGALALALKPTPKNEVRQHWIDKENL